MEPMTPQEYEALTDEQRLGVINDLATHPAFQVSTMPPQVEMELDAIRVILRNVAAALSVGNLAMASSAITDRIFFLGETPNLPNSIVPTITGIKYVVDAVVTHADGTTD